MNPATIYHYTNYRQIVVIWILIIIPRIFTNAGNFLQKVDHCGGRGRINTNCLYYYISNIETLSHFKSIYKLDKSGRSGGINPVVISPGVKVAGWWCISTIYLVYRQLLHYISHCETDDISSGNFCKKNSKRYGKLGSYEVN